MVCVVWGQINKQTYENFCVGFSFQENLAQYLDFLWNLPQVNMAI